VEGAIVHKHFAEWYNAVALRPKAETLEVRWKAVEAVTAAHKVKKTPDLARVFFKLPGGGTVADELRNAAKKEDTTYIAENDQTELTVLAGGVIALLMAKSSSQADAAALAVVCIEAQGLRKAPRLQGVVDHCRQYLADESVRVRAIDENPVKDLNVATLTKRITERGGVGVSDANSVWNGMDAVFKDVLSDHTAHTKSANLAINESAKRLSEQTDILWWLFGGYTLDGKRAFSELGVPEACYWGARDLAKLTRFMPGPFASPAFLHRMLRLVKDRLPAHVRISDAVDECEKGWKENWLPDLAGQQQVPDVCPMLFAISKSVEVGGGAGWTAAFDHATGLAAGDKLAPTHLAAQIYSELLLLRALSVRES
jgi:GTPase-associated system helical domain